MKVLLSFPLVIFIFLALTACGRSPFTNENYNPSQLVQGQNTLQGALAFPQQGLFIRPFWRNGPVVGDEGQLLIVVSDKDGHPKNPSGQLSLYLWMPDMGHGSYPVSLKQIAIGVFEASEIYFTMDGLWDIHFQILREGQVLEEIRWPLTL